MNKGLIIASVLLLTFAMFLVSAERGEDNGRNDDTGSNVSLSNSTGDSGVWRGQEVRAKVMKYKLGDDREIEIERENRTRLMTRNVSAHTDLDIRNDIEGKMNTTTRLRVHFPNGIKSELKIMPDTASERALERLRIRVCNESNNCTIQLKQVGQGNQTRASYELQVERHFKLFGLFERKAQVRAEVDAESGNVTSVGKPWWSFLASEKEE